MKDSEVLQALTAIRTSGIRYAPWVGDKTVCKEINRIYLFTENLT